MIRPEDGTYAHEPPRRLEVPSGMLAVDLTQVLIAYTIEFDNASEAAVRAVAPSRFLVSRSFWSNVMRNVGDDGVSVGDLRAAAPGSPVKSMIGGLERWGYVTVDDPRAAGAHACVA